MRCGWVTRCVCFDFKAGVQTGGKGGGCRGVGQVLLKGSGDYEAYANKTVAPSPPAPPAPPGPPPGWWSQLWIDYR